MEHTGLTLVKQSYRLLSETTHSFAWLDYCRERWSCWTLCSSVQHDHPCWLNTYVV